MQSMQRAAHDRRAGDGDRAAGVRSLLLGAPAWGCSNRCGCLLGAPAAACLLLPPAQLPQGASGISTRQTTRPRLCHTTQHWVL